MFKLIERKDYKLVTTTEDEWKKLNRKPLDRLGSGLIRVASMHHVAKEVDAYSLWQKLKSLYEKKTAQNKAFMIRRLVNLKYKNGNSVAEHLSNFQGLLNVLFTMKLELEDEV